MPSSASPSVTPSPLASSTSVEAAISTTPETSISTISPPASFTTPYSFPPECGTVSWNITIKQMPLPWYNSASPEALLHETFLYIPETADYVNSANEKTITDYYSSCFRPPPVEANLLQSYDTPRRDRKGVYRGAVCPQGWAALNLGLMSDCASNYRYGPRTTTCAKTWSTAICCKSGDQVAADTWRLDYLPEDRITSRYNASVCAHIITAPQDNMIATVMEYYTKRKIRESYRVYPNRITYGCRGGPECTTLTQTITSPGWESVNEYTAIYWSGGRAFYPPWSMEWNAEDNLTLEPPWPVLTSDMLIPTWVPGQNVSAGVYDNEEAAESGGARGGARGAARVRGAPDYKRGPSKGDD